MSVSTPIAPARDRRITCPTCRGMMAVEVPFPTTGHVGEVDCWSCFDGYALCSTPKCGEHATVRASDGLFCVACAFTPVVGGEW
jgi:hypothetical protein